MRYALKHDDGNHRDLDCVVTLSKTAPVRNMLEAIEKFHGVRMQQDEEPVLANTHEVGLLAPVRREPCENLGQIPTPRV